MNYYQLIIGGFIIGGLFFKCEAPQRPGIIVNPEDKQAIQAKINNQGWARAIYDTMHNRVTPYVERHQENPEWILSRYMMNWQEGEHYTRFQGDPEGTALIDQEGDAPVPTVRVATHKRPPVTENGYRFKMPSIEDLVPYDTNKHMRLQSSGPSGKWKRVDPRSMIASINGRFNDLALDAAIIYWLSGEDQYAEFAADILMQWANGAVHQKRINGSLRNGMFSVQTLGDRNYATLALVYDFIHDYLRESGTKTANVEDVLARLADTQIKRGFVGNNWYAAETTTLVWSALALSEKARRDSIMQYFIAEDYIREDDEGFGQKSIKTTVEQFFSEEGHWEEPPNYHNYPVGELMKSAIASDNHGYQIFQKYPTLFKASYAISLFTFPNGQSMAFGDSHRTEQSPQLLELALAMAEKYGLDIRSKLATMLKNMVDKGEYNRKDAGWLGLFTYLPEIPDTGVQVQKLARSRDLDFAGCYLQRNGNDLQNGLMYYVQGASYNHNHANGMAMELYGEGFVLGADPGAGVSYDTEAHAKYYKQWAAHNTVLAGGKSRSLNEFSLGTMEIGEIELAQMEPAEGDTALSPYYSYTDTKYHDQSTKTDQRRVMGIVRTSPETGYYIDIFRSNHPAKNEYIYHNIGHKVELQDQAGSTISLRSSNDLNEDFGDAGPGYVYFNNKKTTGAFDGNVTGTFTLEQQNEPSVFMNMVMAGEPGRKYFTAETPRTQTVPEPYDQLPTPTVVVRQKGPAWKQPFAMVFEPYRGKSNNTVNNITEIPGLNNKQGLSGYQVRSKNLPGGRTQKDYIFHALNYQETYQANQFSFQGGLGIISEDDHQLKRYYLNNGNQLLKEGAGITGLNGSFLRATLAVEESGIFYSADNKVRLHIPYTKGDEKAAYNELKVYYRKGGKEKQGENIDAVPASEGKNDKKGIISVTLPQGYHVKLTIR